MLDTTRKMIQFLILSSFYLYTGIPVKQKKSEQKKVLVVTNMSWSVSSLPVLDTDSVLWVPGIRYLLYQYTVPGSQYVNIPVNTSNS